MRADEAPRGEPRDARPAVACGCPTSVAALLGAWLAMLLGAGLNAGWLFSALMKAGLQFRSAQTAVLDSDETGRVMAGVLAQPAFLVVFVLGLVIGPFCAWRLMRRAGANAACRRRFTLAAAMLAIAGGLGVGQLWMARRIADRALERTEALVSDDQARAVAARSALDIAHRSSETAYAVQVGLVAMACAVLARRPRV
jgi:hypothetical protein